MGIGRRAKEKDIMMLGSPRFADFGGVGLSVMTTFIADTILLSALGLGLMGVLLMMGGGKRFGLRGWWLGL